MRLIKFPSIEQYRNVVRNVQHKARFIGIDDFGSPIFNYNAVMPKLVFEGTVKLHGTNAGVVISKSCEMWSQSRENIITIEKDNAGFAMFAYTNYDIFQNIASCVAYREGDDLKDLAIYGEWCGGNIQKGVAICKLPKMFIIFGMALVGDDGQKAYLTRDEIKEAVSSFKNEQVRVIYDFQTWEKEIDFENPTVIQNELNEITLSVESECPVGKQLGVSGVGEGVVWKCITPGYEDSGFWFKVKGEKHANSKIRTLATVDVEKLNNIRSLAEQVANNERLEQMYQKFFDTLNGGQTDMSKMGDFIKAVMSDIFKEEIDLIAASGFSGKELSSPVCKICRKFISEKI